MNGLRCFLIFLILYIFHISKATDVLDCNSEGCTHSDEPAPFNMPEGQLIMMPIPDEAKDKKISSFGADQKVVLNCSTGIQCRVSNQEIPDYVPEESPWVIFMPALNKFRNK
ncbi:uncharacterized protein LOC142219728 [Haematobia irritans]|uniref:uncharacterized protein LOC142219728 n=1 Tax=Haematobia irritans TaxID=7368 RepID=UPI003F507DC3